jgi:hypothetical protein
MASKSTTQQRYNEANLEYQEAYQALADEYGSFTAVPVDKHRHISEIYRGKTLLATHPDEEPTSLMNKYSFGNSIIELLTGSNYEGPTPKAKRVSKYSKIEDWCAENIGAETTVYQIAEVGEVSYPTANNFVKTRVDLFHKVKKGLYIVRDPKTEREMDKD